MISYTLKVGATGFVLTGVVIDGDHESAAVLAEQPWGQVAAILRDHGVTLMDVAMCAMRRDEGDPERLPRLADG